MQQQVLVLSRQLRLFQQAQLSNNRLIRKSGIFALFYPFILEKRMEKDERQIVVLNVVGSSPTFHPG